MIVSGRGFEEMILPTKLSVVRLCATCGSGSRMKGYSKSILFYHVLVNAVMQRSPT